MVSTAGNRRIKRTAAQNKDEMSEGFDAIGELVALCERDGFIPKYYVDKPKDKVDRVIKDMQVYTHDLITEELGLENLIENSVKALQREREKILEAAVDEQQKEDELFNYDAAAPNQLTDQDFVDFYNEEGEDEDE